MQLFTNICFFFFLLHLNVLTNSQHSRRFGRTNFHCNLILWFWFNWRKSAQWIAKREVRNFRPNKRRPRNHAHRRKSPFDLTDTSSILRIGQIKNPEEKTRTRWISPKPFFHSTQAGSAFSFFLFPFSSFALFVLRWIINMILNTKCEVVVISCGALLGAVCVRARSIDL